jgi:hypothetical protein
MGSGFLLDIRVPIILLSSAESRSVTIRQMTNQNYSGYKIPNVTLTSVDVKMSLKKSLLINLKSHQVTTCIGTNIFMRIYPNGIPLVQIFFVLLNH